MKGDGGGGIFISCSVHCSCWKWMQSFPVHALPQPSPPLTTVMSSGGTLCLALKYHVSLNAFRVLFGVVFCVLVALPVSLLRGLTAVSEATITTQEHRTQRKTNKPTLNPKPRTPLKEYISPQRQLSSPKQAFPKPPCADGGAGKI